MANNSNASPRTTILTLVFAVIILPLSMLGFGMKFIEFVHAFRGDSDGIFAITPMVNYILASLGFLCLLVWATINGMFHDIEKPKETMLEIDTLLDQQASKPL